MHLSQISELMNPQFFDSFFEVRHVHWKGAFNNRELPDAFGSKKAAEMVMAGQLTRRDFDIITEGSAVRTDNQLKGGVANPEVLIRALNEGSTLRLFNVHLKAPVVDAFKRELSRTFRCPVTVNGYLTPQGRKGFNPHYDQHEVFVLQMEGSKNWTVFENGGSSLELPLKQHTFEKEVHSPGPIRDQFTLEPGDLLYIPRGHFHCAESTEEASVHLTFAVHVYTWATIFLELLAQISDDNIEIRKAIRSEHASALDFTDILAPIINRLKDADLVRESIESCFKEGADPLQGNPRDFTAFFESSAMRVGASGR
ncbi:MAG: hypothetical protein JKP96_01445 [Oceanicaulis sp.]|mgnify:FL=1|jgi:ribosomal protein L16 Arg81 hydroxylase|nr:hypothetical protein [Oceanicaulis sp.]